jgi:hypothetical protein
MKRDPIRVSLLSTLRLRYNTPSAWEVYDGSMDDDMSCMERRRDIPVDTLEARFVHLRSIQYLNSFMNMDGFLLQPPGW